MIKRLAMWIFKTEWIPLGRLAPHVLAVALGSARYGRVTYAGGKDRISKVVDDACSRPGNRGNS